MSKTGLPEVLATAKELLDRQYQRLECKCSRRQWKWLIDNAKNWTAGSARDEKDLTAGSARDAKGNGG